MRRGDRVLLTSDDRIYEFIEYQEPTYPRGPRLARLKSRFVHGSSFTVLASEIAPCVWDDRLGSYVVDNPLVN